MFQAFVRQAYHPLPSHQPGESETKYKGKLVHETQLNCFYIKPGELKIVYLERGVQSALSFVAYSVSCICDTGSCRDAVFLCGTCKSRHSWLMFISDLVLSSELWTVCFELGKCY